MAVAKAKLTQTDSDFTGSKLVIFGTVAVDANPATYATGGLVMDLSGIDGIKSSSPPIFAEAYSMPAAGVSPSGYEYGIALGTNLTNSKLAIFTGAAAQSPLAELTNGAAIPAAVSGDVIVVRLVFKRDV